MTFGHVIERFIIHFFAAPTVMILGLFAIRLLRERKPQWDWIPARCTPQLIFLAIIIPLIAFIREPFDVSVVGDPLWKTYLCDLPSWCSPIFWFFVIRWLIRLDWD